MKEDKRNRLLRLGSLVMAGVFVLSLVGSLAMMLLF